MHSQIIVNWSHGAIKEFYQKLPICVHDYEQWEYNKTLWALKNLQWWKSQISTMIMSPAMIGSMALLVYLHIVTIESVKLDSCGIFVEII